METIAQHWNSIQIRISEACKKVKREPTQVRVIAVTKTVPLETVIEAYEAGARIFGENYVQEALRKMEAIDMGGKFSDIEWHFIGALQSNKAKQVVEKFSLLHSLDRWSLVEAIEKQIEKRGISFSALIEVNLAGERTKAGISVKELHNFLKRISSETKVEVLGLMVFPPLVSNPEDSRPYFKRVRELAQEMESLHLPRISMKELSMGVTNDFEVAVEEGATLVRIGTGLFGSRISYDVAK